MDKLTLITALGNAGRASFNLSTAMIALQDMTNILKADADVLYRAHDNRIVEHVYSALDLLSNEIDKIHKEIDNA